MKVWMAFMVAVLSMVLCSTVYGQEPNVPELDWSPHWSIEGGGAIGTDGDSLFLFSAMYWRDYVEDGGIGIIGIGDDTGDGEQSIIAGPGVEFPIGPVTNSIVSTLLPDNVAGFFEGITALTRPSGRAGLLFDEHGTGSPMLGGGMRIFWDRSVQIIPRTDWLSPQGRGKEIIEEGFLTSINVAWLF
jgi:hypothetical protein